MTDSSPSECRQARHIFLMWLSQWKLTALDRASAESILAFVLDSMGVQPDHDAFWLYLQQFFDPSIDGTAFVADPEMKHRLVDGARLLPPRQAKRLLEHLSGSYSLSGEDVAFWRIVEKALEYDAAQPPKHRPARLV
jgi:hypothetical protein